MSLMKTLNKLTKSRDYGEAFIAAMDGAIKAQHAPRMSKPNIKPSKAGCIRQMFYILSEYTVDGSESVDPDMALIQEEGSAMHNIIQDILANADSQGIHFYPPAGEVAKAQQMGIRTYVRQSSRDDDTPYEVSCYNEDYDISFKFDGVISFMNKKPIFELKNEDHFKWMRRVGPEPDHIVQATFYSICLGIDYVLLVYVGRNYKKRKAYLIEITEEMKQTQITRILIAKWCKEHKIVPGKEEHKGCRYCSYKKHCKKDGDQTHEGKINMKEVLGRE